VYDIYAYIDRYFSDADVFSSVLEHMNVNTLPRARQQSLHVRLVLVRGDVSKSCFRNGMYTTYSRHRKYVTTLNYTLPNTAQLLIPSDALLETLWRWRLVSAIRDPPNEPKPSSIL
jgi:hypothetical protein